jgi:serine protease Do
MFRGRRFVAAFVCLALGAGAGVYLGSTSHTLQAESKLPPATPKELTSYRHIVRGVVPAVVSIESRAKVHRPGRAREGTVELGLGSGVIVDSKGVVLTNFHVIDGADFVEVHLSDGRKFISEDMAGDKKTDLAIVRIKSDKPFPALALGDSTKMEVGDRVLAVGAPFGLAGSVTHGIISARSRNLRLNAYEDFLQTDAAINPGNSGGPLVNLEGEVIGINSAIKSRSGGFQGVGLAISSDLAKVVMAQLLKDGVVHRSYLGVEIVDVDANVAKELRLTENSGALVTRVLPDSPGSKCGLKAGDVVTRIGNLPIREGSELRKVVAGLPVGRPVEIALMRDGKSLVEKVTVEEQPDDYGLRADPDRGQ